MIIVTLTGPDLPQPEWPVFGDVLCPGIGDEDAVINRQDDPLGTGEVGASMRGRETLITCRYSQ